MIEYLIIPYMSLAARASGGGLGAEKLIGIFKRLPELLFAMGFGLAAYQYAGFIGFVLTTIWSFLWMETGHGVVLPWGRPIPEGSFKDEMLAGRTQTLTPLVDLIAKILNISTERSKIDGTYCVNYCRLFMIVKGFLISLPVGGILLAPLWALSYEIGTRLNKHEISEFLSGVFSGIILLMLI